MCKSAGQILQLHEELLVDLQMALGDSDQGQEVNQPLRMFSKHTRWRSMDSPPPVASQWDQIARHSIDTSRPRPRSFMADTHLVLVVAKVFDKLVSHRDLTMHHLTAPQTHRFLAYEEYAAHNAFLGEAALRMAS